MVLNAKLDLLDLWFVVCGLWFVVWGLGFVFSMAQSSDCSACGSCQGLLLSTGMALQLHASCAIL
jgi:hypothetical protein